MLLVASIFVSQAFLALYVALFFYGLYSKNRAISVLGGIFAIVWLFIFDFDFSGKPKGYLIDTMAVFGAAFSPFVFIYFMPHVPQRTQHRLTRFATQSDGDRLKY